MWRAPEGLAAVPVGDGIAWTRCRCVPAGPGCGARGRRRGLAGLRDDAPSRRLAARTARGRAAAHGHTKQPGPTKHSRRPEHQRRQSNTATSTATTPRHTKSRHPNRMSACGGARGIRTPDLLIANETRYQLRHSPKDSNSLAPSQSAVQADHRRVRHDTQPTHATAPRARRPAARHHNDLLTTGPGARPGRHPGQGQQPDRRRPLRSSGHQPGRSGRSGEPERPRRCAGCRAGRCRRG